MSVAWTRRAACRGRTALMFPDPSDNRAVVEALRVCQTCPVIAECRRAGRGEPEGVWAGQLHAHGPGRRRSSTRLVLPLSTVLERARARAQARAAS